MGRRRAVIRLSPPVRAAIQRATLPLLIVLSAAIIVLGKADQMLFDSLRTATGDSLAPALETVTGPVAVAGNMIDRVRGFLATYTENQRLVEENARLLKWQQTALGLAEDNKKLRSLVKAVPEASVAYVTAR